MGENVVKKIRARQFQTVVVPGAVPIPVVEFPVLDDLRHRFIEWVDALETAGGSPVRKRLITAMRETQARLLRVRGSLRHQRLAEFLQHSVTAIENDQTDSARYILLTAMAVFGWPTPIR